jgi:hypothetical protein
MANRYGLAVVSASVAVTGGGIACEIAAGANRVVVRSVEVTWATGVTGVVGLGRPGNTPTTGTANLAQAYDTADSASITNIYVAGWGTAPTVPSTFMKRSSITNALGSGVIWNFEPDKLVLGTTRNLGLVVWVISLSAGTATTYNVNVEIAD